MVTAAILAAALTLVLGWRAIERSTEDGNFVGALQNTSWGYLSGEEAQLTVKFGRATCGMFEDGKSGTDVFATLMNAIGDINDPNGIPANQVSDLMDVAIESYCPQHADQWGER